MFKTVKRLVAGVLAAVTISAPICAFANDAIIKIDGVEAQIPEGMGSIVIVNDRTYVPVRFLLEHFNYAVEWLDEEQCVMGIDNDNNMFMMQIGTSAFMYKPSAELVAYRREMDVAPFLNDDENRTYVPIRFLAEAMGYEVGYDYDNSIVTLDKKAE